MAAPERELVEYDLVFATGRSAIEALCAGCAVVVCDHQGLGELVTADNYERLRAHNFALRALTKPISVDQVVAELHRYNVTDTASITRRIRQDCDLKKYLSKLEEIYAATIVRHQAAPPSRDDIRRAEKYFLHEALPLRSSDPRWPWLVERAAVSDPEVEQLRTDFHQQTSEVRRLCTEVEQRIAETEQLRSALEQRTAETEQLRSALEQRTAEAEQLRSALKQRTAEAEGLTEALHAVYRSRSWQSTKLLRTIHSSLKKSFLRRRMKS